LEIQQISRGTARDYKTGVPEVLPAKAEMLDKVHYVGFEVLMVASMKMTVFWVVVQCSLVEVYQHFRGTCCLHHQGINLMMEVLLKCW
jgi:hypothetical protein